MSDHETESVLSEDVAETLQTPEPPTGLRTPLAQMVPGPWFSDHRLYIADNYTFHYRDYECFIQRADRDWVWNGYVTLPKSHPDFGRRLDQNLFIPVHGGVSFSDGQVVGFDTQHWGDIIPSPSRFSFHKPTKYWTFEMVLQEVQKLVDIMCQRRILYRVLTTKE